MIFFFTNPVRGIKHCSLSCKRYEKVFTNPVKRYKQYSLLTKLTNPARNIKNVEQSNPAIQDTKF